MKKMMVTAVATASLLIAANATAQVERIEKASPPQMEETLMEDTVQDGFQEIKTDKIPNAILESIKKDYKGANIVKVSINKERDFKIVLQEKGVEAKTLYANAKGKWIRPKS